MDTCSNQCRCSDTPERAWDILLPISRRGHFFQDSFFSSIQQEFDAAVKDVLSRWDKDDEEEADTMKRYRRLRSVELKDDTQAVKTTSDDSGYKVVLDVHEFDGGEVEVKVVAAREVVVEGRVESSGSSKFFSRQFIIPETFDMKGLEAVMSSDGVLTITVPKQEGQGKATVHSSTSGCDCIKCCLRGMYKTSAQHTTNTTSSTIESSSTIGRSSGDILLPIISKGSFLDDAFFFDIHQEFDAAVRDILGRWDQEWDGQEGRQSERMDRYRRLRSRDAKEETQAVTKTSHNAGEKYVIDVHEFTGGDLKVKLIDEKELVVEGLDKQDGKSVFRKQFTLPANADVADISSCMSSDGILTITIPMKIEEVKGRIIPLNIEGEEPTQASPQSNKEPPTITVPEDAMINTATAEASLSDKQLTVEGTISEANQNVAIMSNTDNKQISVTEAEQVCASENIAEQKQVSGTEIKEVCTTNNTVVNNETNVSVLEKKKPKRELLATRQISHLGHVFNIVKKGNFFSDSFFQDSRQAFETCIKEVLSTHGESTEGDYLACYRQLRNRDLQETTQANTVMEDVDSVKYLLDVNEFMEGGELSVRSHGERMLVVEGDVTRQSSGGTETSMFYRCFPIPSGVAAEEMTANLSSDGILVLVAPKVSNKIATSKSSKLKLAMPKVDINSLHQELKTPDSASYDYHMAKMARSAQYLEVDRLGSFSKDCFFQTARQAFNKAVVKILQDNNVNAYEGFAMQNYRRFRQRFPDTSQAVSVVEDDRAITVAMDVYEFMGGEVKVSYEGENELLVECHEPEVREGNKTKRRSFVRLFLLPPKDQRGEVSCAVSSDGVLVVITKKLQPMSP